MARGWWWAVPVALMMAGCTSGAATPRTMTPAPSAPLTSIAPTSGPTTPTPAPSSSSSSASSASSSSSSSSASSARWQHVVVVVMENRDASAIIGDAQAPYLNQLARSGLDLTDMHAETHPSQPNYVALLSGSTQGLTDDTCPHTFAADNLAHQLRASGLTFVGYSEHLPHAGYTGCDAYPYARRHVPWTDFSDLPPSVNQPLTAMPTDFTELPTVAFVIPDVLDDMHDGTVAQGDTWTRRHLSGYVQWADTHHSLLIVTWDEDEGSAGNHIATMAVGDGVAPGTWSARADHYALLRTLEDSFGLAPLGEAASATPVAPLR